MLAASTSPASYDNVPATANIRGGLCLSVSRWSTLGFGVILTLAALRAYQYPEYSTDGFQYMANAVAMHGARAPEIHATVYREAHAGVPKNILEHLLGLNQPDTSQSRSFQERAKDPYRFTEFLPCFAVRPIFNELVYVMHYGFGVSLLRAIVLIPVLSFWLMGWLAFLWMTRYVSFWAAAALCCLLMLSPPVWDLARSTTPDALSALVLLAGLYCILQKNWMAVGLVILLVSVYVRTDNVLAVLFVLAYLTLVKRTLDLAKGAVLASVAVGSVLLINHFAGDYGPAMLYYRAFVAIPLAPGELVAHFGFRDYLTALRSGFAVVIHEDFIPFAFMGLIACLKRPSSAILALTLIASAYTASHFVLYPEPEQRFFGIFFVAMGIAAAASVRDRMSLTGVIPAAVESSRELIAS